MNEAALRERYDRCPACSGRKVIALSRGEGKPLVLFVGEAPGAEEVREGRPFVGKAGKELQRRIDAIGLHDYRIINTIPCRPEGAYKRSEVAACLPLFAELAETTRPVVVVAVGANADWALSKSFRVEGDLRPYITLHGKVVPYVRVLHPASLYHPGGSRRKSEMDEQWHGLGVTLRREKVPLTPA